MLKATAYAAMRIAAPRIGDILEGTNRNGAFAITAARTFSRMKEGTEKARSPVVCTEKLSPVPYARPETAVVTYMGDDVKTKELHNVHDDKIVPVERIPNEELKKMEGRFKYVVGQDKGGRLEVFACRDVSAAHTGLGQLAQNAGFKVIMGGHVELRRSDGISKVDKITNTSGHFQPEGTINQWHLTHRAFTELGFDADGRDQNYRWREDLNRYVPRQDWEPTSTGLPLTNR